MWIVTLALRNLTRNPARTALTGAAIALCVALTVWSANFEYGGWQDRLEASITAVSGHVVLGADGYVRDPEPDRVVPDSKAVADAIRQAVPDARVLRRAVVGGLLTSPRNTTQALVSGVEPELERDATKLDDSLIEGVWLETGDARGVVIGRTMADTLEVEVGDKLVLMTQVGDDMDSVPLRVRGIYRTGTDMTDGFVAMADLSALQPLLPGQDPAHQIAIQLDDATRAPAVRDTASGLLGAGISALTWDEAMPELKRQMEVDRGVSAKVYMFIFIIVAVVILSTILMSVAERTREFGVLLALGMKPAWISVLVLVESALLGVGSTLVGLVLQVPFTAWLMVFGIDFGDMMAASGEGGIVLDSVMYAAIDWRSIAWYSASAITFTVLAGIFPAWRATRLQPVDAMRHA